MSASQPRMLQLAFLGSLVVAAGCSGRRVTDYADLDLAAVTGTVTLDGKPLAGASIFLEDANGRLSFGTTDASGAYRMMYNSEKPGVTKGKKTVRITTRGGAFEERGGETSDAEERVPARYNTRSALTVVVESDTHTFDFKLTASPK